MAFEASRSQKSRYITHLESYQSRNASTDSSEEAINLGLEGGALRLSYLEDEQLAEQIRTVQVSVKDSRVVADAVAAGLTVLTNERPSSKQRPESILNANRLPLFKTEVVRRIPQN